MMKQIDILFVLLLISCSANQRQEIEEYSFQEKVDKLPGLSDMSQKEFFQVDFTVLFDSVSWDSILVVLPYTPEKQLRALKISNKQSLMDEMREVTYVDWKYGLFFVKENSFVGYTILNAKVCFRLRRLQGQLPFIKRSEPIVNLTSIQIEKGIRIFCFNNYEQPLSP